MTPADDATDERLAILVVYYLKDDGDLPLLRLHLDRIARHTSVPYTIHGVATRATAATRTMLAAEPHLVLHEIPPTESRGNREHAEYLDALVPRALADGADHLCTFDVDSFPVHDDWVRVLAGAAPPESGLSAVLRAENRDVALPHPSCTFARREFFTRFSPSFSPQTDGTPEFRRFLRSTGQSADTGIRLGYALWREGLPWGHLLRTNVVDPHYLMAGIYGDVVFHLGGVGRGKVFRRDLEHSTVHRLTRPIERLPLGGPLGRAKKAALQRARGGTEARLAAANRAAYDEIRDRLYDDSDSLLELLRGQAREEPRVSRRGAS